MVLTELGFGDSLLQLLALAFPALGAGTLHMAVVKFNLLPTLNIPLDGGKLWRGKRIFGDHKTLRGVLVMVFLSIVFCAIQQWMTEYSALWAKYNLLEFDHHSSILYGVVYGLGYTISELPNSFMKRRSDIEPGSRGAIGNVLLDNVDSTLGCFLALYPFISISFPMIFLGVFFLSGIHFLVNLLLFSLNLRAQAL